MDLIGTDKLKSMLDEAIDHAAQKLVADVAPALSEAIKKGLDGITIEIKVKAKETE